jgi:hypothetical protein
MYNHRQQNTEIDSMLDKGSALARPRAPSKFYTNLAPIRKAPIKPGNK